MKELAFSKAGKMHVAYEGNYRFVLWSVPPGEAVMRWTAEVYGRNAGAEEKADSAREVRNSGTGD